MISRLHLKNWRNFTAVDVRLQQRQFIVGPNASGKSNLLDAFRFLHDIAKESGGGLQKAVEDRGGLSKLRCLSARRDSEIEIGVDISESADDETPKWRYKIGLKQEARGHRKPYVSCEEVWHGGEQILKRPNDDDGKDNERLKQTYLEQVNNNKYFRDIMNHLNKVNYMHLVPQLLRYSKQIQGKVIEDDLFGQGFLVEMATSNKRTRDSRLKRIERAIRKVVPRMKEIQFEHDAATGSPHLRAKYSHWRPRSGWQREDQFSDGTLRLIALLWLLMENDTLLLLEEPELSLHAEVVKELPSLFYSSQKKKKKQSQLLISTHSADLLSDPGIGGEEVLMLIPTEEETKVNTASDIADVKALLKEGIPAGDIVIPCTSPGTTSTTIDL